MTRLGISSDVTITSLNSARTQVLIRTMSLCGNGIIDINEQCDGSEYCTDQCTCMDGMEYHNGVCADSTLKGNFSTCTLTFE
jgi:hypothetical protein